ncbi:MAG: tRNA epoxyqueuosine(34) reductase QueG [Prevotellaceae bacterium]|jgi:epoxyqueuosine reductase|nr:tRNA epoxyqueuosine(34) reductase QueG [Prevotellaceae bacterium]
MTYDLQLTTEQIKDLALKLGFDDCGFADTDPLFADEKFLRDWLSKSYNGEMSYMENYFDKRIAPKKLVENAKSVVVVLLNYKPEKVLEKNVPQIAKYAYGVDYHFVIKQKLNQLLEKINSEIVTCNGIAFVDSAPVLERALAQKAGLGWIGKNSMLINRKFGSFCFIGELFLDIELEYSQPAENHCNKCENCIKNCPTKAIISPKIVDARRCLSYLTIEHRSEIPAEFKPLLGNRLFGCDTCNDVCPYNKTSPPHKTPEFSPQEEFYNFDWQTITRGKFDRFFKNSPLKRAGFKKIFSHEYTN